MRRYAILSAVAVALIFAVVGCNQPSEDLTIFQAQLSGANEVPPQGTAASGAAGFTLDGTRVRYSVDVQGISAVTGAHIHSGAAGVNGPIRVSLFPGPGKGNFTTATGAVNGVLMEGAFTASDVTGVTFDQLLNEMRNGTAYANVHTTAAPGGLVRGQVRLIQ